MYSLPVYVFQRQCVQSRETPMLFFLYTTYRRSSYQAHIYKIGLTLELAYLTKEDFIFCPEDIRLSFQQKLATTRKISKIKNYRFLYYSTGITFPVKMIHYSVVFASLIDWPSSCSPVFVSKIMKTHKQHTF